MGERTEAPTARHLAEMRRKGDIAQSPELTASVTLLIAVYLLGSRLGAMVDGLLTIMRQSLSALGREDLTPGYLQTAAQGILQTLARDWLPFLGILLVAGLVTGLVQTRGLITPQRLAPSFDRLNPLSGLRRIFSKQGLFETGKGLIKMALLAFILYSALRDLPGRLASAGLTQFGAGVAVLGDALSTVTRQGALLLLAAAGIDFAFQFQQHRQRMKMTREEVSEELKSSEGQPFIKARIRQLQRRWSRQRMMQELAHADVVVTNPTHMAIALRYDKGTMTAPTVVAKGKGLIAQQIVQKSRDLKIPIVQNIPLAHALINVELGEQIPVALYQAVAEVLAFVYRLRAGNRAGS